MTLFLSRSWAEWRRLRRLHTWQIFLLVGCSAVFLYMVNGFLRTSRFEPMDPAQSLQVLLGLHPSIDVLEIHNEKKCILLPQAPVQGLRLCLHPASYLSEVLKRGKLYEGKFLLEMTKAFENDKDMQLVDIGANIGLYTVWAAALGRYVLSVEMLQENLDYLQNSLQANDLGENVTLVKNAVFQGHTQMMAKFIGTNIGETRLTMDARLKTRQNFRKEPIMVQTICMDDLLPLVKTPSIYLKMDIEGSESHALQCAHKFFSEANVKVVQMEWSYRSNSDIQTIKSFMIQHGYSVSRRATRLVPVDINRPFVEGLNVFFLKPTVSKASFHFSLNSPLRSQRVSLNDINVLTSR